MSWAYSDRDHYGALTFSSYDITIAAVSQGNNMDVNQILNLRFNELEIIQLDDRAEDYALENLHILVCSGYMRSYQNDSPFPFFRFIPTSISWDIWGFKKFLTAWKNKT